MLTTQFTTDEMSVHMAKDWGWLAEEMAEQRSNEDSNTAATLAANVEFVALASAQSERPRSAASHRSKNSTWRPIDQPNLPYVQTLLARLFNLQYSDCEVLIMKRIYHQLDWRDRGYLYRTDIERCYIDASEKTKISIDHKALMNLVTSGDLDRDGEYCLLLQSSRSKSDDQLAP